MVLLLLLVMQKVFCQGIECCYDTLQYLSIIMQGYSTLGSQWLMKGYDHNPVLSHAAVVQAAMDAQRSPAQVVLRWALQHGQVSALMCHTGSHINA